MQHQISDAKNKLRDAEAYRQLVGSFFEQTVADVYELYERELHRMNAMDFDDLLVRAVNVLELFPEVRDRYAAAFRHVLVDEYQDTNHAQYRCCSCWPASTATWRWSATTTSASSRGRRSRWRTARRSRSRRCGSATGALVLRQRRLPPRARHRRVLVEAHRRRRASRTRGGREIV